MGNCQAADAAAVVIQHPGDGKVELLHWPATAADVMRRNPGHYVALVVLHHVGAEPDPVVAGEGGGARITKIKLLKPRDTLLLGQVYRLITSQEVTKAVQTRKQQRMRGCDDLIEQQPPRLPRRRQPPRPRGGDAATAASGEQRQPADHQDRKQLEKDRHRSIAAARRGGRGREWRPALQSITESSSSGHPDCEDTCSEVEEGFVGARNVRTSVDLMYPSASVLFESVLVIQ